MQRPKPDKVQVKAGESACKEVAGFMHYNSHITTKDKNPWINRESSRIRERTPEPPEIQQRKGYGHSDQNANQEMQLSRTPRCRQREQTIQVRRSG